MDKDSIFFIHDSAEPAIRFVTARLSNWIALVCAITLLIQLPLLSSVATNFSHNQFLIIVFHSTMLCCVFIFNMAKKATQARLMLVFVFVSYITATDINFSYQTDMHYFYILGLFVIPVLFFDQPRLRVNLLMLMFPLLFCASEIQTALNYQFTDVTSGTMQDVHQFKANNHVFLIAACFLVTLLLYSGLRKNWQFIGKQQVRQKALLLNILPNAIAHRLSNQETLIADEIEHCSILFADICGFTAYSQQVAPNQLVQTLNQLVCDFDLICQRYGLEKIKTIGDQYMAVSGVPIMSADHAATACECAQTMLNRFTNWQSHNNLPIGIRIGVHSGSAIAGVIGRHKFTYDLWGPDVNFASRMESHGIRNKIQVSEDTYQLCQHLFPFTVRENVMLKGIGKRNTYIMDSG
ncbi:MAG: adenylate/guanylate cyclase domain-containing protein [Aestuariibacter sp.]